MREAHHNFIITFHGWVGVLSILLQLTVELGIGIMMYKPHLSTCTTSQDHPSISHLKLKYIYCIRKHCLCSCVVITDCKCIMIHYFCPHNALKMLLSCKVLLTIVKKISLSTLMLCNWNCVITYFSPCIILDDILSTVILTNPPTLSPTLLLRLFFFFGLQEHGVRLPTIM